jgi:hypothetical protein
MNFFQERNHHEFGKLITKSIEKEKKKMRKWKNSRER